jgi:hypothetical protein
MRTLIAVMTCHAHADRDAAIRETWLPLVARFNSNADAVFICGGNTNARAGDTVYFDCPDTYHKVAIKFLLTVRYAYDSGYDYLIQVDNDTFLMPLPLYIAYLTRHDCMGFVRHGDFYQRGNNNAIYPHGSCFSLSRRAMQAILSSSDLFDGRPPHFHDMLTGQALNAAGIVPQHSERIKTAEGLGWPQDNNNIISSHWIKPVRMRDIMRYNTQRLQCAR